MRYLNLFVALVVSTLFCYGQGELNTSTSWYYLRGDTFDNWYSKTKYKVVGDTTIESYDYKIIEANEVWIEMSRLELSDTVFYQASTYYEYLRSDEMSFYKWNGNEDELVINFDLELNDTVSTSPVDVVTEVDSILIGGTYRKTFITESGNIIYAGIGTSRGILRVETYLGYEGIAFLKCFSQDGENYELETHPWPTYGAEMESCSDYVTFQHSVPDLEEMKLSVFPNPFVTNLSIASSKEGPLYVEILSSTGERVRGFTMNKSYDLSLSNLPSGLYIMIIRGEDYHFSKKIIKR